jgi:hypothetical protein
MKTKATEYFAMIPEWVLYGDISTAAVRVFGCLNRYANGQTSKCFQSRATIAKLCRVSVKTVDRAIEELVDLGAVTVTRRYIDAKGDITENPQEGVEFTSNEYTVIMSLPRENLTPPSGNFDATPRDKNDTLIKEPSNQRKEPDISSSSVDDGFDEFWAIYPRKVAKGAARKAWKTALKKANKDDILAGAILYASIRRYQDDTFTAHPSTWLNAERWADETMLDDNDPEPELESLPLNNWEPCGNCHGGWVYDTDDRGYEVARPCICRP